ncbi:phosphatidylserine decarboxylase family protein [Candidatus Cardinium hertigii]|jgi:phosphatidylserine decarboxylase|uniref:Phosphatidylserine decarboxylase proenzyme n=1 Tax=Candidatus Cardinium hertigii TaxID=247481 RepID=A0A3N2QCK6_9BACT|nr:phosphatidylserine decarboxylase family protein [Candidatus Cardinium hertigii]ROT47528.1 phosphatidylserine decarboxylase family protein [Candidatus Cardinium hertigii]ROT47535.1 phosphatidylserine decarboxylase family protein [Candidatus Cardinium hertigii]
MKIHKEGKGILLWTPVVLLLIYYSIHTKAAFSYYQSIGVAVVSAAFYFWLIYFFRDPYRIIHLKDQYILGPADGKVLSIQTIYEGEYLREDRLKISIFMSPFNVHVNRFPMSGKIVFFKYHPGKHLVAFHPKASTHNERTTVVIENDEGQQILFKQIAGFIARRIKFYFKEGDEVQQGEKCGFIKFGSRMEVYVPLDADIKVAVGDKVKGGITVLAKI